MCLLHYHLLLHFISLLSLSCLLIRSKAFHIRHDKAFKDKAFLAALDDVPPRAAVNTLASDRRTSGDRVGSRTKYSVMDVVPLRSAGVAT